MKKLLFFVMFIAHFNAVIAMSNLYNTIYIRCEDAETPIIMEYFDSVYCCGSSHTYLKSEFMKSTYPDEQEFIITKLHNGKSILSFYISSLAASTNKISIQVSDLDELVISQPNEKNEITINQRVYGKKDNESIIEVARLIAKHR